MTTIEQNCQRQPKNNQTTDNANGIQRILTKISCTSNDILACMYECPSR